MKTQIQSSPVVVQKTLWQALVGPRTRIAQEVRALATEGGRRRFLRLQLRMNEVLTRTNQLSQELEATVDQARRKRLQELIAHQMTRAEMFLQRFDRMLERKHEPLIHA